MKDNMDHRQHSPVTALEWDSYPFSDGDWSPCIVYGPLTLSIQIFTQLIQAERNTIFYFLLYQNKQDSVVKQSSPTRSLQLTQWKCGFCFQQGDVGAHVAQE